jgi:hypothetical protein
MGEDKPGSVSQNLEAGGVGGADDGASGAGATAPAAAGAEAGALGGRNGEGGNAPESTGGFPLSFGGDTPEPGIVEVPAPATIDPEPSGDEDPAGFCQCRDDLCRPGFACLEKYNTCSPVDCDEKYSCPDASPPLYCDLTAHTCSRVNGQCGTVGSETYDCPQWLGWLPGDFTIRCVRGDGDGTGTCQFRMTPPATPKPEPATANLSITQPKDGQTFTVGDDVTFVVRGTNAPLFVFVTPSISGDVVSVTSQAIWGRAFPETDVSKTIRTTRYSEGNEIVNGTWKKGPGTPPIGTPLFVTAYALQDDEITQVGKQAIRFSVGEASKQPGSDCEVQAPQGENPTNTARALACAHVTIPMACVAGRCEVLCLSNADCGTGRCQLARELGVSFCR